MTKFVVMLIALVGGLSLSSQVEAETEEAAPLPIDSPADEGSTRRPLPEPGTERAEGMAIQPSLEDTSNEADGGRPGFGLWIGGLATGLAGFGAGIGGMALLFSEACASESCPQWIALIAVGVTAFVTGIILVTIGRRRMRRARALPEFMRTAMGLLEPSLCSERLGLPGLG